MDLIPTCIILGLCVAFAALASWRAARPAGLKPRMIPWNIVVLLFGAVALYMTVHLLNLLGVNTGTQGMAGV